MSCPSKTIFGNHFPAPIDNHRQVEVHLIAVLWLYSMLHFQIYFLRCIRHPSQLDILVTKENPHRTLIVRGITKILWAIILNYLQIYCPFEARIFYEEAQGRSLNPSLHTMWTHMGTHISRTLWSFRWRAVRTQPWKILIFEKSTATYRITDTLSVLPLPSEHGNASGCFRWLVMDSNTTTSFRPYYRVLFRMSTPVRGRSIDPWEARRLTQAIRYAPQSGGLAIQLSVFALFRKSLLRSEKCTDPKWYAPDKENNGQ